MSKKKQQQVTITLTIGSKVLENVIVKNLGKQLQQYVHLDGRDNKWILLHTDVEMLNNLTDPVVFEVQRPTDEQEELLRLVGPIEISVTKVTKLRYWKPFMYMDQLDDNTYRWAYSSAMFDTTEDINVIKLELTK